jgi:hypothetical protein
MKTNLSKSMDAAARGLVMSFLRTAGLFLVLALVSAWAFALFPVSAAAKGSKLAVSPVRGIEHGAGRGVSNVQTKVAPVLQVRSIEGSGNNLSDPTMGAAHTNLRRLVAPDYSDGVSSLAGAGRPGPREISNAVNAIQLPGDKLKHVSDILWLWGQFLDHDIDLTDGTDPPETADIAVPAGDPFFDPASSGTVVLPFNRSIYDPATGTGAGNPRQQKNEVTSWIDASNVYGSDPVRAAALRTGDGTGRLRVSTGNLLPFNTVGLPNAGGPSPGLFLAGDVRANEHAGLTAMHTLFVREHNRLAAEIAAADPTLTGEAIYQSARRIVGAQMQKITYAEFLPALLGPNALKPYKGYDPSVDARIGNIFSTAAYRFGHSAVGPVLLRLGEDGDEIPAGHLAIKDAFFAPHLITGEGGIEPLLRGAARNNCQPVDPFIVDALRNFLFGEPGAGGFDLASLNIQRGRDHGLPGYNATRAAYGLAPAANFAEISSNPEIQARLAAVYDDVDAVDLWIGGLAEDPVPGSLLGRLFHTIAAQQFQALRDGDRFWYRLTLTPKELRAVEKTRFADIIRRNTAMSDKLHRDVSALGHKRTSG